MSTTQSNRVPVYYEWKTDERFKYTCFTCVTIERIPRHIETCAILQLYTIGLGKSEAYSLSGYYLSLVPVDVCFASNMLTVLLSLMRVTKALIDLSRRRTLTPGGLPLWGGPKTSTSAASSTKSRDTRSWYYSPSLLVRAVSAAIGKCCPH